MWFALVCIFFTFCLFWTLKRVHFNLISPSVFMPAKKTCVHFFNFTAENAFYVHSFKNTSVCTNSYEKNRNDNSEGTTTNKKSTKKEHYHAWLNPNVILETFLNMIFPSICCLLVSLSIDTLDFLFSQGLQRQIHTQNTISPRMTSSCALLFPVSSLYSFPPAI